MGGSSDYVSLIVFALLAVVIIWKLHSILGYRPGDQAKPPGVDFRPGHATESEPTAPPKDTSTGPYVEPMPNPAMAQAPVNDKKDWSNFVEPETSAWQQLEELVKADPTFNLTIFAQGASRAYEMIIEAFAHGNRQTLANLLSSDVFESFKSEIERAEAKGESRQTTIVSLQPIKIIDVHVEDNVINICVQFSSKLISAVRDKDGKIIEGDANKITDHIDQWTFARPLESQDPNWRLVATTHA